MIPKREWCPGSVRLSLILIGPKSWSTSASLPIQKTEKRVYAIQPIQPCRAKLNSRTRLQRDKTSALLAFLFLILFLLGHVAHQQNRTITFIYGPFIKMAERGGFELPEPVKAHSLSRRAQSTTLPPLRFRKCCHRSKCKRRSLASKSIEAAAPRKTNGCIPPTPKGRGKGKRHAAVVHS